jgi:hypothetical protein
MEDDDFGGVGQRSMAPTATQSALADSGSGSGSGGLWSHIKANFREAGNKLVDFPKEALKSLDPYRQRDLDYAMNKQAADDIHQQMTMKSKMQILR